MADVPDPVFAQAMVGAGVAVVPLASVRCVLAAPCDGRVAALLPHAVVVEADGGRGVLVHAGIDTVELAGLGFELHAQVGDVVRAGDRLITWSPVDVAAAGLCTWCPVVALQADPAVVRVLVEPGRTVRTGDPLLDWD